MHFQKKNTTKSPKMVSLYVTFVHFLQQKYAFSKIQIIIKGCTFKLKKNKKSLNIKLHCTCLEIKHIFTLEDIGTFVISAFLKSNCSINIYLVKFKLSQKDALSRLKKSENFAKYQSSLLMSRNYTGFYFRRYEHFCDFTIFNIKLQQQYTFIKF